MVDIEVVDASAPPWPVVEDEDWRSTTTAFLPFLQWHEHVCLRPVGVTTLEMPASPFFSLFLRGGCGHIHRHRRSREYDEGEWREDRACAGRVRRVKYVLDVVDDAQRSRQVTVHELQRFVATADGYLYETRSFEAGRASCLGSCRGGGGGGGGARGGEASSSFEGEQEAPFYSVERWAIKEQRGLVRSRTVVHVFAAAPACGGWPAGLWRDEAARRFDAWHALATAVSYSDAVATMASDALFGGSGGGETRGAATKKKRGAKDDASLRPFVAPVPPSRVDVVEKLDEPPLGPGEGPLSEAPLLLTPEPARSRGASTVVVTMDVEERAPAAKEPPSAKRGLGCGDAPPFLPPTPSVLTASRPDDATKRSRSGLGGYAAELMATPRHSGSTYEIVFRGEAVGLQFADLGTGRAIVDGHEGYETSDAPPGVGSALLSVNGVRVEGLTFASTMALAGQRKRPLTLGFVETTPDALVESLLHVGPGRRRAAADASCGPRDLDFALEAPEAKPRAAQGCDIRQRLLSRSCSTRFG